MNGFKQLSVVIITKDAASLLPAALESLPPEAEVIVADGGSQDDTVVIAQRYGAKIVSQDREAIFASGGNFDVARNRTAQVSQRTWTLFLDADERLSPELRLEIDALLSSRPAETAYEIPRVNLFWGHFVRLLGQDYQLRLVRKGKGHFEGNQLHQRMAVEGSVGRLSSSLVHLNVRSWREWVRRIRHYVPIEARTCATAPSLKSVLTTPIHLLHFYYVKNQARKDGVCGLLVSIMYAFHQGLILWEGRRLRRA